MRRRTRSDANQKEIDKALRAVGASVLVLGDVGKGCPDRAVGYRGETYLIEVKNAKTHARRAKAVGDGLMTDDQIKFRETWRGRPVVVVFTVDEALKAIGAKV